TGSEMIVTNAVWGGRFDPATNDWSPVENENPDVVAGRFSSVWTGDEMILWGGFDEEGYYPVNLGARYNPGTDQWLPTSTVGAPSGRYDQNAIWIGNRMLVWGGINYEDINAFTLNDG